jgi:molybdate transport system regulatory protein
MSHSPSQLLSADLKLAGRLDARFFALLQALHATGSINRAAGTAGYSYKGARLVLETASNLAHAPLVHSARNGSALTAAAQELLQAWQHLQAAQKQFLHEQEHWLAQHTRIAATLRRLAMKTSARNQFTGTVTALALGPVSSELTLRLGGGAELLALLQTSAVRRLKLDKGSEVVALVKASAVVLVSDFAGHALSAANQLDGAVSRIERGAVSSLVGITLPGGTVVTASVTNDAVSAMGLAVGQKASAVFAPAAVMLAVAGPPAALPATG